ncbi:sensor histidine kinase [Sphingomonas sp.]|uniref:sensor histidine kinase n=1 Tax=Sphingomonas sp. TaxID=28214 RepID=UPI002C31A822|nr:sensor histidine kinase [Sphingomonas sp.]HWK35894.1 sensor histidine kinase [Sphingomonas sp.]
MTSGVRNSLKFRLIVGSAIGVVAAVLLAGLFIGNLYRVHTTNRYEAELDHHVDELVAMIRVGADGRPRVIHSLSDPQFAIPRSGLYWQVEQAGTLLRSPSLAGSLRLTPAADNAWHRGFAANAQVRQRSVRVTIEGRPTVVTIASLQHLLDEQVAHFAGDLALSMGAVCVLLLGGAGLLVRFGLAPVRRLSEDVDRLRNGETERLDPAVPTEFAPIVTRFNALLEGQAQLITRARTESGNLAHNLRTPLALISDEAEQLRLSGQVASADFLLARCAAMQLQIDHHLARAAAAGTRGAGTLTEVAPLLAPILDALQRLHARAEVRVTIQLPDGLRLPCDRGDLAEILSNLIDNAFKWTSRSVIIAGGPSHIQVRDDGPGIPHPQRAAAMAVGTRLNPDVPGTGLGLAATADLLRFYGGRLMLDEAPEGGLSATASFAPE